MESNMHLQVRIPVRNILVFWIFLLSAVAFLDRTNISIAGPFLASAYHLSNIRLGWVFSSFLIGYAAFQVAGGWLAVRVGPRRVLTVGVMWWGLFTALTATIPTHLRGSFILLIAVRFALGAGESVVYPAANQFVARWIPIHERGKANGWIFAGVGAGAGLTPPLIVAIITRYGWRASFWFSAGMGLVVGIAWYFISRDTPVAHPLVSQGELECIQSGLDNLGATQPPTSPLSTHPDEFAGNHSKISWGRLLCNKNLLLLTFSYFTYGYVAWLFFSWFYIYLAQVRDLNLKASSYYTMLPFLAMTVCCPLGGIANDWISSRYGLRMGRSGLGIISLLLTAIFLVFGSTVHSAHLASFILAGGAGSLYLSQSSFWSVSADIGGHQAGIVSGVMNMGAQCGGAMTASLTPMIALHFGWSVSFFVAAGLSILGGIAWMGIDPNVIMEGAGI